MRAPTWLLSFFLTAVIVMSVTYVAALDEGARAPAISARSLSGDRVTIPRGKVVIVDFWASWCDPCREAMPALNRIYSRYKDHGLTVIGVSVDNNERNARQFLRRTRVQFPVVHDAGHSVADRYNPPTMPSTYVIDKRGVVRHVHTGFRSGDARRLESLVRELL